MGYSDWLKTSWLASLIALLITASGYCRVEAIQFCYYFGYHLDVYNVAAIKRIYTKPTQLGISHDYNSLFAAFYHTLG